MTRVFRENRVANVIPIAANDLNHCRNDAVADQEATGASMDYLNSIPISDILPGRKQVEQRLVDLETTLTT